MMWLYENDNPLVWAGQIVALEVHTKDESERPLTLDELAQIAEFIDMYVEHARVEEKE